MKRLKNFKDLIKNVVFLIQSMKYPINENLI